MKCRHSGLAAMKTAAAMTNMTNSAFKSAIMHSHCWVDFCGHRRDPWPATGNMVFAEEKRRSLSSASLDDATPDGECMSKQGRRNPRANMLVEPQLPGLALGLLVVARTRTIHGVGIGHLVVNLFGRRVVVQRHRFSQHAVGGVQRVWMPVVRIGIGVEDDATIENRCHALDLGGHVACPKLEKTAVLVLPILVQVDDHVHSPVQMQALIDPEV